MAVQPAGTTNLPVACLPGTGLVFAATVDAFQTQAAIKPVLAVIAQIAEVKANCVVFATDARNAALAGNPNTACFELLDTGRT